MLSYMQLQDNQRYPNKISYRLNITPPFKNPGFL